MPYTVLIIIYSLIIAYMDDTEMSESAILSCVDMHAE